MSKQTIWQIAKRFEQVEKKSSLDEIIIMSLEYNTAYGLIGRTDSLSPADSKPIELDNSANPAIKL